MRPSHRRHNAMWPRRKAFGITAAEVIGELKRACLLPAPGTEGLTADERRKLRNRMKAARRGQR